MANRQFRTAACMAVALPALLLPGRAEASAPTIEPKLKIAEVRLLDTSGCQPGDTAIVVGSDSRSLDILFRDFKVTTEERAPAADGTALWDPTPRSRCAFALTLQHSAGWAYTTPAATIRGYADLADGAVGRDEATVSSGTSRLVTLRGEFTGPAEEAYSYTESPGSTPESPCDGPTTLTINRRLSLNTAHAAVHSTTVIHATEGPNIGIAWRRC